MPRLHLPVVVLSLLSLSACGVAPPAPGDATGVALTGHFERPEGMIAIGITVDDSANRIYGQGDLAWMGSMRYQEVSRVATYDAAWSGPYPKLWDDGAWTAGGHEPEGAVAGDRVWGAVIFVRPPAAGEDLYTYGVVDSTYQHGWLWNTNANGNVRVVSGAADLMAQGLVLPPAGSTDLKFVVNIHDLTTVGPFPDPWDTSSVHLTSGAWGWDDVALVDDGTGGDEVAGDGHYTFVLSASARAGGALPHTLLPPAGDAVEFAVKFGPGDGVEYRDPSQGRPLGSGVSVFTQAAGARTFSPVEVGVDYRGNWSIAVPR